MNKILLIPISEIVHSIYDTEKEWKKSSVTHVKYACQESVHWVPFYHIFSTLFRSNEMIYHLVLNCQFSDNVYLQLRSFERIYLLGCRTLHTKWYCFSSLTLLAVETFNTQNYWFFFVSQMLPKLLTWPYPAKDNQFIFVGDHMQFQNILCRLILLSCLFWVIRTSVWTGGRDYGKQY